jgi:hypothetical protein
LGQPAFRPSERATTTLHNVNRLPDQGEDSLLTRPDGADGPGG